MKSALILFVGIFLASFKPPVETDYKKVFGDKYTWAVDWLNQNDGVIKEYATAFNIPDKELKAIVFPELIRYNSFFNALEIESLKFLYVNEGKAYADFSVGYFQMKPSFGEMIEMDARNLLPERYQLSSGWNAAATDNEQSRRERVKRLSNVRHQLIYLCAFYKICENRFRSWHFGSAEDKIRMFATCYNAGYKLADNKLVSFLEKKNFYQYNYSSISAYYYAQECR